MPNLNNLSQEQKNEIVARLKTKISQLVIGEKAFLNYHFIYRHAEQLRLKYPNFNDFLLYHVMVGSTPADKKTEFDFPGTDSVVKFIKSL